MTADSFTARKFRKLAAGRWHKLDDGGAVQMLGMASTDSTHGSLNRFHLVIGVVLASAGTFLALTLWRFLRRPHIDDDASQLCRLVSPRRSKDDDKRIQLKRRQGCRQRSPRSLDMCSEHPVLKKQNTM